MTRTPSEWVSEHTEIDFLIIADRAEGINGKLYMMGGGWDRLAVADFAQPVSFSIAISILVPWNETNQQQELKVTFESEDGTIVVDPPPFQFQVGRPPTSVPVRSLVAMMGSWILPAAGAYRIMARLSTGGSRAVVIYATPAEAPRG